MNNGNYRRNRRRYKVRYDRIFAVVLVLIVLIVIITSCTKGCSDDEPKPSASQSSVVDNLTGSNPAQQQTDANGQASAVPEGSDPAQASDPAAAAEFTTQNVEYTQVYSGDLVLINSLHDYKFQEGDVTLTTLYDNRNSFYSVKDNVLQLDSNTITQLNALMEAYASAAGNTDLQVIGGYRTLEEQTDKYNSAKSKFPGGYTDYHSARTFDIGIFPESGYSNYYAPDGNYAWFNDNAANYGFIVRFPDGKDSVTGEEARTYTFRYVGIPHAVYMKQNNLCLEEYIEQIKTYTSTNTLKVTSGTSQYEVYYVPANPNAATGVPVPSKSPYTISGNNVDGFIVTLQLA